MQYRFWPPAQADNNNWFSYLIVNITSFKKKLSSHAALLFNAVLPNIFLYTLQGFHSLSLSSESLCSSHLLLHFHFLKIGHSFWPFLPFYNQILSLSLFFYYAPLQREPENLNQGRWEVQQTNAWLFFLDVHWTTFTVIHNPPGFLVLTNKADTYMVIFSVFERLSIHPSFKGYNPNTVICLCKQRKCILRHYKRHCTIITFFLVKICTCPSITVCSLFTGLMRRDSIGKTIRSYS